jgi:hypothetical protein
MTDSRLQIALRGGASGLRALEAGTELIIAHGSWIARDDFGRFIQTGASITSPGTELAVIAWDAAIASLNAGVLPSSGGEKRMLRLAASFAGQEPIVLGDAVPRDQRAQRRPPAQGI